MKTNAWIVVVFGVLLLNTEARAQIVSNFSVNSDGWSAGDISGGSAQTITYNSTGGDPGGYISLSTANPNPMYWSAPSKFLGNIAYSSFGEMLSFDVQTSTTSFGHAASGDIMLLGTNNQTLYLNFNTLPSAPSVWTTMTVMLRKRTGLPFSASRT